MKYVSGPLEPNEDVLQLDIIVDEVQLVQALKSFYQLLYQFETGGQAELIVGTLA